MAYRSARKARVPGSRGKKRTNGILSAIGFLAIAGVVGFVAGKMTLSFGDKVVMLISEAHR
ncbi:MAG: hypothetical protein ACUVSV_14715, partial [Armatimonadota bacterium]